MTYNCSGLVLYYLVRLMFMRVLFFARAHDGSQSVSNVIQHLACQCKLLFCCFTVYCSFDGVFVSPHRVHLLIMCHVSHVLSVNTNMYLLYLIHSFVSLIMSLSFERIFLLENVYLNCYKSMKNLNIIAAMFKTHGDVVFHVHQTLAIIACF